MLRKLFLIIVVGMVLVACGELKAIDDVLLLPTTTQRLNTETASVTPLPVSEASKTPINTSQPIVQLTPTLQPTKFEASPTLVSNSPYLVLTYAPTPQPALEAHEWTPESEILISLQTHCSECYYPRYSFNRLFLYANGLLLREREDYRGAFYYRHLDERKICKVMNTIDQVGFFDYDPLVYKTIWTTLSPSTSLEVNAWRFNSFLYDAIGLVSDEQAYKEFLKDYWENPDSEESKYLVPPVVLPALQYTYTFVSTLDLGGWKVYQPDRFILVIYPNNGTYNPKQWPLAPDKFKEINTEDKIGPIIMLVQGNAIKEWIGVLEERTYYALGDEQLSIWTIDPILPHEELADVIPYGHDTFDFVYGEPVPPIDLTIDEPISCKVIDGVYEIP